ncbi:MAG: hypothetical protein IT436_12770 [Phycisphaerales bacterium]|nr:hypothetical protein [Phycisphaerales bacterium]
MFNLSAHTTDDRGKRVPVFAAGGEPAARFEADPALHEIATRIADSRRIGLYDRVDSQTIVMGLFIMMIVIGPTVLPNLLGMGRWGSSIVYAMCLLMMWPGLRANTNRLMANRTRATLLREGRCPSCAYIIAGLPTEPDGRTTCPECSAAWTRDSIGTPTAVLDSTGAGPAPLGLPGAPEPRANAIDALDRVVPLRDPLLRDLDPGRTVSPGPERLYSIRAAVLARTRGRKFTGALVWLLVWLFAAAPQILLTLISPGPLKALPIAIGIVFTAVFGFQIYLALTYRSRSTALPAAKVLIEHNLCPSCAGELNSSPDSPLLTCPTCGAAWKPGGP